MSYLFNKKIFFFPALCAALFLIVISGCASLAGRKISGSQDAEGSPSGAPLMTEKNGSSLKIKAEEKEIPGAKEEEKADPGTFQISDEEAEKIFFDVKELIEKLNAIIKKKDFTTWKTYLTDEYMNFFSGEEELKKISLSPVLKKQNITIRSLKDYFLYVVVPSRANAKFDNIDFIDDNNIMVYTDKVVLYQLKNIDGSWKIDLINH